MYNFKNKIGQARIDYAGLYKYICVNENKSVKSTKWKIREKKLHEYALRGVKLTNNKN